MIEVRTLAPDDVPAIQALVDSAFGSDPDPEEMASWRPLVEPDRTLGAYDAADLVGTAAAFTFDLTVPGGPLPVAGVTGVGVRTTARRRGVLRALMEHQLAGIRERGIEPVAALWASEPVIYPRFGYGVASRRTSLTVEAHDPVLLGRSTGAVRAVDAAALRAHAEPLYEEARRTRTGMISRSDARWRARLADVASRRGGASAHRYVIHDRGYAIYRTKPEWTDGRPHGSVRVVEVVALDADAHGALWRLLLGVDLMRTTTYDNLPTDDPLPFRLRDPRAARLSISDGLYVRVLDVPAALTGRAYRESARFVLDVVDDRGGWAHGRWTLDVTPDGATCTPTTESPDLTLGAEELGAVYLGDTTLRTLSGAGRVDEHTPGAVDATSRALAWGAAWCPEIF